MQTCKRGELAIPKCMLVPFPGIPYTLDLAYQTQWPLQASSLSHHLQALKYNRKEKAMFTQRKKSNVQALSKIQP